MNTRIEVGEYRGWSDVLSVSRSSHDRRWSLLIEGITMPNGDTLPDMADEDISYESAEEAIASGHSLMRDQIHTQA